MVALLGRFDEGAAPVVRIRQAANEPGGLHPVEPVGYRPAREAQIRGELASGRAVRRPDLAKVSQEPRLAAVPLEALEALVQALIEVPAEALDPLADPLRQLVEAGDLACPHVEHL